MKQSEQLSSESLQRSSTNAWLITEKETKQQHAYELSKAGQRQHFIDKANQRKAATTGAQPTTTHKQPSSRVLVDSSKTVPLSPSVLGRTPSTEPIPAPFNFYLYPASQQAAVLVDRVFAHWMSSGHIFRRPVSAEVLQNYRKILECVVMNVLKVLLASPQAAVRIRREEALYRKKSRYRPQVFDKKILTVLDDLHSMQILQQVKGERWHNRVSFTNEAVRPIIDTSHEYKQTRLFVGHALTELAETLQVSSPQDIGEAIEQQEIIVLKQNETSALAEYEDSEDTHKLREQMRRINLALQGAGTLLSDVVPPSIRAKLDEYGKRHLIRRFTYNSFASGGRLWGGFWMELKKVERPHCLRIKGEKTVECDYAGILPRLAYLVIGEGKVPVPPGDVYNIPGLSPKSRGGIKTFLNAMLMETRTTPRTRFHDGVAEQLAPEDRVKGFKKVFALVAAHHPVIAPFFFTGIGHYLQSLESTLLVNVLLDLGQRHVVALPLHDGLIVQESKAELVCVVMERRALSVLNWEIPVKVKGYREGLEECLKAR